MALNTDNNTIALQVSTTSGYYEGICWDDDIIPGMLLLRQPAGFVAPHSLKGDPAENLYAMEAGYHGRGISDPYVQNERVYTRICRSGDVVLSWVVHLTLGIVEGSFLMSFGSGTGEGSLTSFGQVEVEKGGVLAVLLEAYIESPVPTRKMIQIL